MAVMSEPDQIPVVGGPFDGQAYWFSSARFLHMPSAQDAVTVVRDGEALTLFGEHIYEMKCYAQDGEKSHRWDHVGYKPPECP
jgi:hypothetical protein